MIINRQSVFENHDDRKSPMILENMAWINLPRYSN